VLLLLPTPRPATGRPDPEAAEAVAPDNRSCPTRSGRWPTWWDMKKAT